MRTVHAVAVSGYRSLRRISFPVDALSVFVGGNGTGKTNLGRALELRQAAAHGALTRDLAADRVIRPGSACPPPYATRRSPRIPATRWRSAS
jgi:recombinational DNA repair ATPase RecF